MTIVCPDCGALGFANRQALGSHRSSKCPGKLAAPKRKESSQQRLSEEALSQNGSNAAAKRARVDLPKDRATPLGAAVELASQPPAQPASNAAVEAEDDGGFDCGAAADPDAGAQPPHESFAEGATFLPAVEEPERVRFPELSAELKDTLKLLEFIRGCRNRVGLSAEDTNRLLGLLHSDFKPANVKFQNAREMKKFEEEMVFREEDVSACCLDRLVRAGFWSERRS